MQHLKDRLQQLGKSQRELAIALGRDKSAITLLLQGKRQLKAAEIPLIAAFLSMSEAQVLGLTPAEAPTPKPPAQPSLDIPIVGRISDALKASPNVRRDAHGHYGYIGAPLPSARCFLLEIEDHSLDLYGLLPQDLVLCDPQLPAKKDSIVLVKQTLEDGAITTLLRNYQPPFLEVASTREGFERLHESRANVAIIATVTQLIRHYTDGSS